MIPLDQIPLGDNPPGEINLFVTAPAEGEPLALRIDETSGALTVTHLFQSAMRYPGNCGVVPHTAVEDGMPLQAMMVGTHRLAPGTIVAVRPVGVLYVTGEVEEITLLTVPLSRLTPRYDRVASYTDLPAAELRQIAHFFCHYREVEEHGRPRTSGWGDVSEAHRTLQEAAARARRPADARS
ncbi:inorganic diphosphatase [Acuticoccus mangrovi]|uniref:inorganic diphosphatase n=1 Tax=Acuticoccus mangrovi TaxID=2796142 RepID=A0A934IJA3_9HYPH|nr:inorganic diphosphatase [Acuticoccus mangrovi]